MPLQVSFRVADVLRDVAELELLQAPGLPYIIPRDYVNLPHLTGLPPPAPPRPDPLRTGAVLPIFVCFLWSEVALALLLIPPPASWPHTVDNSLSRTRLYIAD